jgi:hypothetical protein
LVAAAQDGGGPDAGQRRGVDAEELEDMDGGGHPGAVAAVGNFHRDSAAVRQSH